MPPGFPNRLMTLADLQAVLAQMGLREPLNDLEIARSHENTLVGDRWFNEAAPVTLLANAANQLVVSFQLPVAHIGILRQFATFAQTDADLEDIIFAIRIAGQKQPGYDRIQGPIANIIFPPVINMYCPPGSLIEIVASNTTAANINDVTALLRGTYFPGATPMGSERGL